MTAPEKGRILAKDSFLRSELNFLNFQPKNRMAAYSPDRVYPFNLRLSAIAALESLAGPSKILT